MEEHKLLIVEWVNRVLGPPVAALLGIHAEPGHDIIPMHVVVSTLVLLVLMLSFAVVRARLSVEKPGKVQMILESFVQFLESQIRSNIGHHGLKHLPLIGTLFIFILCCNLAGLIPGLGAPTTNINFPAGLAVVVFLYYHYQGVRAQGALHYAKHFMGPIWWLTPLMIPIEIISHLARPLSLTIRLFANIFAEEMVVVVFFTLFALFLPLPFMVYAVFGGTLQAYIFITLSQVYLAGATTVEEHH